MSRLTFQLGLDRFCREPGRLRRARLGLIAHPASVDGGGVHAALRLRQTFGKKLGALFGPEHGFYGRGGAGEEISDTRHAAWNLPIYSLYGDHRKPTAQMLAGLDAVVFDLQDLAVRCYTFVTTLRYVMEACAEQGKTLVVCDRPVPLPNVVDGPLPVPGCESFVAGVPVPLVYGMTPGEAARFLHRTLKLDVDLRVVPMRSYRREASRGSWGPWISPSPGIRYWETAWTYPITVFTEALSVLDCGRGGTEPFQVLTAPFFEAEPLARKLNALRLPGLRFVPYWNRFPGVRLQVIEPDALKPAAAALQVLAVVQRLYGYDALWTATGTRREWFDKLMGNETARNMLEAGGPVRREIRRWRAEGEAFHDARSQALLY
jgi:uncharacterized protein YbbC (DUF1343 family)